MTKTLARYLRKLPKKTRSIVLTSLYGITAGIAAVAFHKSIQFVFGHTIEHFSTFSTRTFLIGSFCTIIGSSLIVGLLLSNYCKDAAGSGIPQLKLAFWSDFGHVPWKVTWVKFIAGILSIGGGCSLGREGPSVQLASGVASNLAGLLGEPKQNRRHAASSGAAAGLAAAFNTPLAAITFVLEEIVQDLNSRFLGSVLLASVLGAFAVHALSEKHPALEISAVGSPDWLIYLLTPVVAAAAALVGVLFQKTSIGLRATTRKMNRIPAWIRPAIGALIAWGIAVSIFLFTKAETGQGHLGVFGVGYEDLNAALTSSFSWKVAGLLLIGKLIATIACYGMGGCGGIFSPALFLGGMTGVLLSGLFGLFVDLTPEAQITLAVVGMSSCLGAVVRAPVTGILIVFEMTNEFYLVPALMLGALISSAVSRQFCKYNFYEELLEQDGHQLEHVIPPRDLKSWQQLPVSAIANFSPVIIKDLSPEVLSEVLEAFPYLRFPVVVNKEIKGVITREEAKEALEEQREPELAPLIICAPSQSIRELQYSLIESATGLVGLVDPGAKRLIGIVTLHDLLRREVAITKEYTDDV
ncbi:MAG: chloride channel protein [Limisphaerales bacterium]|nr:chloride channel protein [Pedosphaera sp.]HBP54541.1 chloride channel protein [Verrucomicrobiales bacterium]|tara:strand:- start:9974 stop:11719 length:1746 start_codon:yes stop_codon:yes gene_type:complete